MSGRLNLIDTSKRDTRAESKSCLRLVAQITKIFENDSKESSFLSKVDKILRVASCRLLSLVIPNESISSMNKIH